MIQTITRYITITLPVVILTFGRAASAVSLENPLSVGSIEGVLDAILEIILIFAIPIVIFFIVFAGFKYVTAQGNPGEISKANKALMYALIGGAIILGAQIIGDVISDTVDTFR